jgi:restriction system protein
MRRSQKANPFSNFLPADLFTGFVGREKELSKILKAFQRGARGVLIVGPPGIGKTSLANVFAERYKDTFPGGIFRAWASLAESSQHLFDRTLDAPLKNASLFIIDDAEVFDESALYPLQKLLQTNSKLSVILTSRIDLSLSEEFQTINLAGLSTKEFRNLLKLRTAFGEGKIDGRLVEDLYKVSNGNPFFGSLAAAAVRNGIVASWSELFAHVRNFYTPGLVSPDGRPLTRETAEYQHVVVDVTSTNSAILDMLKKQPELAWKLPSRKFEEIVAEILDKQGYEVTLTPASKDGGFDIYAARKEGLGKFLYLVECKRYAPTNKVGVEIVRSLYGVIQAQRATAGAIVTTSFFTSGAKEFQREVQYHLHLHDYLVLQNWIADFPFSKENVL